ncbi:MAG: hypothetical protein U1F83_00420 [Verrucomicrobiota bacterium]
MMLGVSVLIIVISVMSGFDHDLREKFFGFQRAPEDFASALRAHDELQRGGGISGVKPQVKGVSPFVAGQIFIETQVPVSSRCS